MVVSLSFFRTGRSAPSLSEVGGSSAETAATGVRFQNATSKNATISQSSRRKGNSSRRRSDRISEPVPPGRKTIDPDVGVVPLVFFTSFRISSYHVKCKPIFMR